MTFIEFGREKEIDRREREVIEISHLNELVNEFLCIAQVQSRELLLMVCCRAKVDDGLE